VRAETHRQQEKPAREAAPASQTGSLGLCLAVCLVTLSLSDSAWAEAAGGSDGGTVGVASREAAKRQDQIRAAQELFTDAELDRREGNNREAVEKYRTAFKATPNVPAAAAMRESIFKRYQLGVIAWAEELTNEAKWKEAEAALVQLMNDARDSGMGAGQIDPTVRTMLTRLRSDDYHNKAMTPEHLANVSTVENLLTEANGFFEIGDFSTARKRFEAVLNIDRYNNAARRGMEKVEQIVMEYEEVARNQTRSTMLRQVAEGWDLPVPNMARGSGFQAEVVGATGDQQAAIRAKLNRIVIPQVEFISTPLQTVVEYLTQVGQDLDTAELDPSKRGFNIVVDTQNTTNVAEVMQKPITLKLSNAPFETVLKYVTDQAQMKFRIDSFAISIVPQSASNDVQLITRTYQVPPSFITGAPAGGAAAAGPADPFAAPAAGGGTGGGTLVKRISAKEFLEGSGVTFPPGSLASFNPVTSSLVVKNTPDNISLIEQMILASKEGGAKLVRVEFKLIETTDRILNEIGFDWLIGQGNVPGSDSVFAGGGTLGNQSANRAAQDFPFLTPGGAPVGNFPVTGGLRSGLAANTNQTIDDIINRDSPTTSGSPAAPGILSLAGVFTDPQFQVVLRALSQKKGNDMLCSAAVVTRPGERAIIKQVREFIYPTEYDPPEIPNQIGGSSLTISGPGGPPQTFSPGSIAATPATPAAFETRELGKILEVEPVVGGDNLTVDLNLIADVSEFSGFINYGSPITGRDTLLLGFTFFPPTFFTQTVEGEITPNRILMPVFDAIKETTQVTIYDGQTVIVGGLLGETVNQVQDKVPFLGDAPGIGKFFRTDIEERVRRALVLFATVRILDPSGSPLNDLSQMSQSANGTTAAATGN
jgi:general secretion pathway protein D